MLCFVTGFQMPLPDSKYKETIGELITSALSNFSEERCAAITWALHLLAYKECRERLNLPIFPFTYQQILNCPVATTTELLKHAKTSLDHVQMVTDAMKRDSQQGSFLGKDLTSKKKRAANFSITEMAMVEEVFAKLDLPPLEQYETLLQA